LRSFLKKTLPDYMVPQKFVLLDKLPLTPNGKLDRKALPDPLTARIARPDAGARARDDIQEQLLKIWTNLLGRKAISISDNFFDLGGHSLLATSLLAQVRRQFGQQLSIAQLFQAPTVERLAELLRDHNRGKPAPVVTPIQPHGTRPPLYCVGAGPLFRALAKNLGPDQPTLGVTLDEADLAKLPTPYRVEDMARLLLAKIREHQPRGPYFLGGYCQNGAVAYEVAQQLTAQNEPPPLLVLFDVQNPDDRLGALAKDVWRARLAVMRHKSHAHWRLLQDQGLRPYLREHTKGLLFRVRDASWRRKYRKQVARGANFSSPGLTHEDILLLAVPGYSPKPYSGAVAFFQAEQLSMVARPNLAEGWSGIVQNLQMFKFPGEHNNMLEEPFVHNFTRKLKECLCSAQQQKNSGIGEDERELQVA
jgi:thioesterase domain-containing protein/acyl carrier protein